MLPPNQQHWALSSISSVDIIRADTLVSSLGRNGDIRFVENIDDEVLLDRVALAYEMVAIDGLDSLACTLCCDDSIRDQTTDAARRAFQIRRLAPIPEQPEDRVFHVLTVAALACCGDSMSDMRIWLEENRPNIRIRHTTDTPWDLFLLYRVFECWVRIFQNGGIDNLAGILDIIAELRNDQREREKELLSSCSAMDDQSIAMRLIAMYHWVRATELLADYILHGKSRTVLGDIDKHFESAINAATASGDYRHEMILRWLRVSCRIMVTTATDSH